MLAPAGLTFTRLDASKGRFAWDPVAGATAWITAPEGATSFPE